MITEKACLSTVWLSGFFTQNSRNGVLPVKTPTGTAFRWVLPPPIYTPGRNAYSLADEFAFHIETAIYVHTVEPEILVRSK
jgi:hypothetical protein